MWLAEYIDTLQEKKKGQVQTLSTLSPDAKMKLIISNPNIPVGQPILLLCKGELICCSSKKKARQKLKLVSHIFLHLLCSSWGWGRYNMEKRWRGLWGWRKGGKNRWVHLITELRKCQHAGYGQIHLLLWGLQCIKWRKGHSAVHLRYVNDAWSLILVLFLYLLSLLDVEYSS